MSKYQSWMTEAADRFTDAFVATTEAKDKPDRDPALLEVEVRDRTGRAIRLGDATWADVNFWGEFIGDRGRLNMAIATFLDESAATLSKYPKARTPADLPPLERARLDVLEMGVVALIEELGPIDGDPATGQPPTAIDPVTGHLLFAVPVEWGL